MLKTPIDFAVYTLCPIDLLLLSSKVASVDKIDRFKLYTCISIQYAK